jgi:prephenate dehydrogenase
VTADEHDAAIALTSHLPQVLSTALGAALAQRLGEPAVAGLCGPGIASLLRLADSPGGVWAAILDANAAAVAQEVRAFAAILRTVADEVEAHDAGALAARFAAAGSVRARLGTNDVAAGSVTRDTPSF